MSVSGIAVCNKCGNKAELEFGEDDEYYLPEGWSYGDTPEDSHKTFCSNCRKLPIYRREVWSEAIFPNGGRNLRGRDTIKAIYVDIGGNIRVQLKEDPAPIIFTNIQSGTILPIKPKKIYKKGTTATGIIAVHEKMILMEEEI